MTMVTGSSRNRSLVLLLFASLLSRLLIFALGIVSGGFSLPNSEPWMDYAYAYIPTVQAFRSGYLPYVNFYHAYPPLFLYALAVFSILPFSWAMALPLIISDALTVVPVYLIAKRFMGERNAFLVSLFFALAPINLYYVDYVWLNPPLTTLFLMISIYYLLGSRFDLSAITLALSVGFKQTSLLALPIMMLFISKKASRRLALKYLALVTSVCFVFSIPYIFLAPRLYLFSIFRVPISAFGQLPKNYFQLGFTGPPGATTMNTATLTGYDLTWVKFVPLNAPVDLALPLFIFFLPGVTSGLYAIAGLALTVFLLASYGVLLYRVHRKERIQDETLVKYVLLSMLLLFTLNPVYKYYVAGITPLLALLLQRRRDVLTFEILNIAVLLIPRLLTSYLLLLVLLWLLRSRSSVSSTLPHKAQESGGKLRPFRLLLRTGGSFRLHEG